MKLLTWKFSIFNFFLGLVCVIAFYFGACYHLKAIDFAIQKNSTMATFYNTLGSNWGLLGVVVLIVYFVNTFSMIKKLLSREINKSKRIINIEFSYIIRFLYSNKTQRDVFEPITADWQEEYFEALFRKEIWKARWINVRYIYAFLIAMWQKSPIGDLIEFVRKFAR